MFSFITSNLGLIFHVTDDDICLHLSTVKSVHVNERYAKFTTKF